MELIAVLATGVWAHHDIQVQGPCFPVHFLDPTLNSCAFPAAGWPNALSRSLENSQASRSYDFLEVMRVVAGQSWVEVRVREQWNIWNCVQCMLMLPRTNQDGPCKIDLVP